MLKTDELQQRTFDLLDWPAKRAMHKLRSGELRGQIANSKPVVTGIWFEWDDEQGDIKAEYRSSKGQLLEVDFDVQRPGRWLTLNIGLNAAPLIDDKAVMLVCRLSASNAFSVTPIIRIGYPDRFQDISMDDTLHVAGAPQVLTAIFHPGSDSPLRQPHRWKKVMLDISQVSGELHISDLCCFGVDANVNRISA